jgi:hypothetical protein
MIGGSLTVINSRTKKDSENDKVKHRHYQERHPWYIGREGRSAVFGRSYGCEKSRDDY